jgi:hypothetical protein
MSLDWFQVDNIFQNNTKHLHAAGFYNFGNDVRENWVALLKEAKQRKISSRWRISIFLYAY